MAFPDYPSIPSPWPNRAQGQSQFDASVSATFAFYEAQQTWNADFADAVSDLTATLVATELPSLMNRAGYVIGVNSDEDGAGFLAGQSALFGPDRNKIANGLFDVWQRGTTFSVADNTSQYTADRWLCYAADGATCEISRQTHTLGLTDVPNNPTHYLRFRRTVAGTTSSFIEQRIEGVRTFAGKKITITCWVRPSEQMSTLRLQVGQNFGTGGSPSPYEVIVTIGVPPLLLANSWQKIAVTYTVPSVAGKTLGTNGDDYLAIRMSRPHDQTGATADLFVSNFSVVEGDAVSEIDPGAWRSIDQEESRCYRYFYRLPDGQVGTGQRYASASGSIWDAWELSFPVTMRKAPTVAVNTAPTYVNCSDIDVQAGSRVAAARVTTAGATPYRAFGGVYSFSAEL